MNGQAGTIPLRIVALLATYMQAVNVSLPNAALRFIQGALSMSDDQAGWIFTSYLAASAITMPLAGWLAMRFGLKRVYQTALMIFALGLLLVPFTDSPLQFIGTRLIQGAASGLLAPLSLSIAMETLPVPRRMKFASSWTAIVLLGIVSGPSLGGWLSDHFGWHNLFTPSLPLTGFICLVIALYLPTSKGTKGHPFDFFGFGSFTLAMIALQILLDRGERLEWFSCVEIWIEAIAVALGLYLFTVHRLTRTTHFLNKALFQDRNFVLSTLLFFALSLVLLSTMALTSPMLDELLGYPPTTTGYLTLPRGIALVGAFVLMGFVPDAIDRRWFIAIGMALVILANALMLNYSPSMDEWPVAEAGAIQGLGLGILMPALSKMAFSTLEVKWRAEAAGLFNLARVYGSTLGVAIVQILLFNNAQAMHQALASQLTPYHATAVLTATTPLSSVIKLNELISGQGVFIAVIDQFKLLMLVILAVSPLVLFLRKPTPLH